MRLGTRDQGLSLVPNSLALIAAKVAAMGLGFAFWLVAARFFARDAVGLAAAAVSAVYSVRALWLVYQPAPPDPAAGYDTERQGTRRITALMRAPLLVLAPPAFALGVLGLPPVAQHIQQLVGGGSEALASSAELAASAALALGTAAVTWWWGERRIVLPAGVDLALANWLGLERLAHLAVVRPTLTAAEALAAFDDRVVAGTVLAAANGLNTAAAFSERILESSVDGFVVGVARSGRQLGALARRPQTGQLHQYYAQAVILLAALGVILLVATR
jgi:hypothetical protein